MASIFQWLGYADAAGVLLGQQWPPGFAAEKSSTNHFGCLETLKENA